MARWRHVGLRPGLGKLEQLGSALVVLFAAASGCGGEDTEPDETPPGDTFPPDPFRSGSRLRWTLFDGGDGAIAWGGLFDTETNQECFLLPAADGKERCLPFTHAGGAFTDAACTLPGVAVETPEGACGPPSKLAVRIDYLEQGAGCYPPVQVAVFRATATPVPAYAFDETGACVPLGVDMYATERVEPSEFVAFETKTQPLAGDLARELSVGADGTYGVVGARDVTRDEPCSRVEAGGVARCFPVSSTEIFGARDYADASCSQPAVQGCDQRFGREIDVEEGYECQSRLIAYELGPRQDSAWQLGPDGCQRYDTPVLPVGESIPEDSFPPVDAINFGRGALRGVGWGRSDARLGFESWFDVERGAPCKLVAVPGGARCLPAHMYPSWYADEGCSEPVARDETDCGETPAYILGGGASESECDEPAPVLYERGVQTFGPFYSISYLDGSCEPVDVVGDAFYRPGAAVPIEDFPFLSSRMD